MTNLHVPSILGGRSHIPFQEESSNKRNSGEWNYFHVVIHTIHTSSDLIPCYCSPPLPPGFSLFASLPLNLLGSQNLIIILTGSHNFVQVKFYQGREKTWILLILEPFKKSGLIISKACLNIHKDLQNFCSYVHVCFHPPLIKRFYWYANFWISKVFLHNCTGSTPFWCLLF